MGGCCVAPGALSEEESGEKKLTDRGLTGLKARFSMKRKGSMSDVTADGVSSEDDTAEEAAAPFTPPMPRYATIAGAGSLSLSLSHLLTSAPMDRNTDRSRCTEFRWAAWRCPFWRRPRPRSPASMSCRPRPTRCCPRPRPRSPKPRSVHSATRARCQHGGPWMADATPDGACVCAERRTKISNEIIETERSYISSLKRLIQVYHQPLLELCAAQAVENPNTKLTTEGINKIFSTLPSILPLNEELLNRLEVPRHRWFLALIDIVSALTWFLSGRPGVHQQLARGTDHRRRVPHYRTHSPSSIASVVSQSELKCT